MSLALIVYDSKRKPTQADSIASRVKESSIRRLVVFDFSTVAILSVKWLPYCYVRLFLELGIVIVIVDSNKGVPERLFQSLLNTIVSSGSVIMILLFTRKSFTSILFSLLLVICLIAESVVRTYEVDALPYSENSAENGGLPRVTLSPFRLALIGAERALDATELNDFLLMAETVVFQYATSRSADYMLRWVKFNSIVQTFSPQLQGTYLDIGVGAFSFDYYPVPSHEVVMTWVQESLENNLMPILKSSSHFTTLTVIEFELVRNIGISNDVSPTDIKVASNEANNSNSHTPAILAGTVTVAAVLVIFIAVLALLRRHKQHVEIENLRQLDGDMKQGTNLVSTRGGHSASLDQHAQRRVTDDGRSLADSESEWTVATEAGDSTALKSLCNANSKVILNPYATNNNDLNIRMVMSEAFERDRQVAISKDMLTGLWSGAVSQNHINGRNDITQSESVLQPSHFSASQERRVRRAAANSSSPDLETSSISSVDDNDNEEKKRGSVMFEQADVWDAPSPSRTSQSRTRHNVDLV